MIILYFLVFILINLIFIINYRKISKFINLYDYPDSRRKIHSLPVPLYGGTLLYINLTIFIATNYIFLKYNISFFDSFIFESINNLFVIFISSTILFIIGFVDDKFDISANLKFLLLILVSFLFIYLDKSLLITELNFSFISYKLELDNLAYVFSIFSIVIFINAFNMFDGINMQSNLYSIVLLLFLILIGIDSKLVIIILIFNLFFLYLNKNSSAFMGDSGTLLLGYLISIILIKFYNRENSFIYADTVFLLLMTPGLDLCRVMFQRIFSKKNPFTPDRQHLHHLLLNKFNLNKSLILLYLLILMPILIVLINFKFTIYSILINMFLYFFLIYSLSKNEKK
tara:strand:+ start:2839 stop:3864 length:1026 start_codon:yes stop_codon:yes gene_type:complete